MALIENRETGFIRRDRMTLVPILDRARIVAQPGFNRWLVPPAALAIHLSIGMIYGMSVFWLPLTHTIGSKCQGNAGAWQSLTTTTCDWTVTNLVVGFEIGIVFLGASAAIWGGWLERVGPRRAGVVATCCWSAGLMVACETACKTFQIPGVNSVQ